MERLVHGVPVRGVGVGPETRCAHYHTSRDVIAIRFACCGTYYPCAECHDALADHPPETWDRSAFDREAVLCGVCGTELRIDDYLDDPTACPECASAFNPGCADHHHLYFDRDDRVSGDEGDT